VQKCASLKWEDLHESLTKENLAPSFPSFYSSPLACVCVREDGNSEADMTWYVSGTCKDGSQRESSRELVYAKLTRPERLDQIGTAVLHWRVHRKIRLCDGLNREYFSRPINLASYFFSLASRVRLLAFYQTFYLQCLPNAALDRLKKVQYMTVVSLPSQRGKILDRKART